MPNLLTSIEVDLYWLCGAAGLATLGYALYQMLIAQSRPAGQHTGAAHQVLRTRYLVIATLLFIFLGFILWRPLPIQLPTLLQLGMRFSGQRFSLPAWVYTYGVYEPWERTSMPPVDLAFDYIKHIVWSRMDPTTTSGIQCIWQSYWWDGEVSCSTATGPC